MMIHALAFGTLLVLVGRWDVSRAVSIPSGNNQSVADMSFLDIGNATVLDTGVDNGGAGDGKFIEPTKETRSVP